MQILSSPKPPVLCYVTRTPTSGLKWHPKQTVLQRDKKPTGSYIRTTLLLFLSLDALSAKTEIQQSENQYGQRDTGHNLLNLRGT